jgi:hypothetical protein
VLSASSRPPPNRLPGPAGRQVMSPAVCVSVHAKCKRLKNFHLLSLALASLADSCPEICQHTSNKACLHPNISTTTAPPTTNNPPATGSTVDEPPTAWANRKSTLPFNFPSPPSVCLQQESMCPPPYRTRIARGPPRHAPVTDLSPHRQCPRRAIRSERRPRTAPIHITEAPE